MAESDKTDNTQIEQLIEQNKRLMEQLERENQPVPEPEKVKGIPEPEPLELASRRRRVAARLLDGLLIGIPGGIVLGMMGIDAAGGDGLVNLGTILLAAIGAAYDSAIMTAWNGSTIGKRALGIRVVKDDGEDFTLADAVIRSVVWVVVANLVIGIIWPFIDREKQGLHDKAARTHVVTDVG